jgi:hypothetical protein
MPELPDIVIYVEALQPHVVGSTIEKVREGGYSRTAPCPAC